MVEGDDGPVRHDLESLRGLIKDSLLVFFHVLDGIPAVGHFAFKIGSRLACPGNQFRGTIAGQVRFQQNRLAATWEIDQVIAHAKGLYVVQCRDRGVVPVWKTGLVQSEHHAGAPDGDSNQGQSIQRAFDACLRKVSHGPLSPLFLTRGTELY